MQQALTMTPIAVVRSPRRDPTDDYWGGIASTIELDGERFSFESLAGLDAFSHIEVVFVFHLYSEDDVETRSRRPRGRKDWPEMGIFAQRNKHRPNRLGVSRARIIAIEGTSIRTEGLDAIDGTPVLDIKPYFAEFGPRGEVHEAFWVPELMRNYFASSFARPE